MRMAGAGTLRQPFFVKKKGTSGPRDWPEVECLKPGLIFDWEIMRLGEYPNIAISQSHNLS